MTNDEIKDALIYNYPIDYDGVKYDSAQAWRVTFNHNECEFISSLELVKNRTGGAPYTVTAPASKCEISQSIKKIKDNIA